MKKVFFISAFAMFTLIACHVPFKTKSDQATPSKFLAADSIPSATAKSMIAHYLEAPVDHDLDSIIKQVSLHNTDLYQIALLSTKKRPITRIRLLAAAYLDTDPIVARRNHKTVLLQLKFHYNSEYNYYDIQSLGDGRLCPPPMGCSTE